VGLAKKSILRRQCREAMPRGGFAPGLRRKPWTNARVAGGVERERLRAEVREAIVEYAGNASAAARANGYETCGFYRLLDNLGERAFPKEVRARLRASTRVGLTEPRVE
jgi:hypothetical protein